MDGVAGDPPRGILGLLRRERPRPHCHIYSLHYCKKTRGEDGSRGEREEKRRLGENESELGLDLAEPGLGQNKP